MIFTKSTFSRWKPNFIEKSPPKPFILGARITRKLQKINLKNIPKNNYVLRPFFWDFGKVLGASVIIVGPVFASQNQFLSFFFRSSNFLSILERFGRVWGEFGEGLGRVLEGFWEDLRKVLPASWAYRIEFWLAMHTWT